MHVILYFSIVIILTKLWPFCHFLAFFHILNHLTERADFWCDISVWFINYSDYVLDVLY